MRLKKISIFNFLYAFSVGGMNKNMFWTNMSNFEFVTKIEGPILGLKLLPALV